MIAGSAASILSNQVQAGDFGLRISILQDIDSKNYTEFPNS
jgi:hypothetical protein